MARTNTVGEHSLDKQRRDRERDFIAAWSRLDVEEIVSFFTPDGTYHNMMNQPVSGHDNLRKFIGGFIGRRRHGMS